MTTEHEEIRGPVHYFCPECETRAEVQGVVEVGFVPTCHPATVTDGCSRAGEPMELAE